MFFLSIFRETYAKEYVLFLYAATHTTLPQLRVRHFHSYVYDTATITFTAHLQHGVWRINSNPKV